jgi:hypothetical protein
MRATAFISTGEVDSMVQKLGAWASKTLKAVPLRQSLVMLCAMGGGEGGREVVVYCRSFWDGRGAYRNDLWCVRKRQDDYE